MMRKFIRPAVKIAFRSDAHAVRYLSDFSGDSVTYSGGQATQGQVRCHDEDMQNLQYAA
jgi:hypothetical protein